jgi:hypothetical protein
LSSQYGLACDNVVNYEMVLASGQIINANATSTPDLFVALKGGGNQFGIITQYTLKTYEIGKIWGGVRIYGGSHADAIIRAVRDFAEFYPDEKAAVIVTVEYVQTVELFTIFFFYNGPGQPDGIFDSFTDLDHIISTTKVQTLAELLTANNNFNSAGDRLSFRAQTLPILPYPQGYDLFNTMYSIWQNETFALQANKTLKLKLSSMAYQPLPKYIGKHSEAAGGNALDFKEADGDRLWVENVFGWDKTDEDSVYHDATTRVTDKVAAYLQTHYSNVQNTGRSNSTYGSQGETYLPLFYNDAMYNQEVLQSYRHYEKLKATQRRWDPFGFWPRRTSGFKY